MVKMTPVYNSKGEQVSGFIRPKIHPKRQPCTDVYSPLPSEGDGILAIIKRNMDSPMLKLVDKKPIPLYVPNQLRKVQQIKEVPTIKPVNVRLVVTDKGIKVKLDTLSWQIYQEYFFKGKKPPLGPYLRSLVKSGASDSQLEQVIKSYKKWENPKFLDEIDAMIQRIWPGSSKSKSIQTRKVLKAVKKL